MPTNEPPFQRFRDWVRRWSTLITVGLVLWAGAGRVLVGIVGWGVVLFAMGSVPLALVIVAQARLVGARREDPREFGPAELTAILTLWMGLFGLGLFLVDVVTGYDDERSVFTRIAGDTHLQTSFTLAGASFWLAAVAWATLFVLLIARGFRGRH